MIHSFGYQIQLLPPANEVCEGYVFTGVCLSTGGVHDGGHAWQGGMHGRGVCMVWQILWDMVNEQVVRILLECILVCNVFLPM